MSDQELRDALRALAAAYDVPDAEIDLDLWFYGMGEDYPEHTDHDMRNAWRDGHEAALHRVACLLDQPTGEAAARGGWLR